MGVSALSLHAKGTKQENFRNYNPTVQFFFKKDQGNISCTFSDTTKANDGRINTMMNSVAVFHAEIRWVMKVVTSHFSDRSCLTINSLLASMFLDIPIVKSFQLSITRCAYYTVFGLVPYYK